MSKTMIVTITMYEGMERGPHRGRALMKRDVECSVWRDMATDTVEIRADARKEPPMVYTAKKSVIIDEVISCIEVPHYGVFERNLNMNGPYHLAPGDTFQVNLGSDGEYAKLWTLTGSDIAAGGNFVDAIVWDSRYEIMAFDDSPEWEGVEVAW